MSERYALYYAPPDDSALARFGAGWLGRDATGRPAPPPPTGPELSLERWWEITAEARQYGFHGTLKAPMALAPGIEPATLHAAVAAFAAGRRPFAMPPLTLASLGGFLALVPGAPAPALDALAAACVTGFDRFRAPPTEAELARRRAAGLTPRQDDHLQRWGYPYVLEDYSFHLTLTCRLDEVERQRVQALLAGPVAPLCLAPVPVDSLCLFHQPDRQAPFSLLARYRLGGG